MQLCAQFAQPFREIIRLRVTGIRVYAGRHVWIKIRGFSRAEPLTFKYLLNGNACVGDRATSIRGRWYF